MRGRSAAVVLCVAKVKRGTRSHVDRVNRGHEDGEAEDHGNEVFVHVDNVVWGLEW